jgi:hypothetical protein
MAADNERPELPKNHAAELYGWMDDLPELGE